MSPTPPPQMPSVGPYLLRALYAWINDAGFVPQILVDCTMEGVEVPASYVKAGKIVLNISMTATHNLSLGDTDVSFVSRFNGASRAVRVPIEAIIAIYARENGHGMALPTYGQLPASAPTNQPTAVQAVPSEPQPSDEPPRDPTQVWTPPPEQPMPGDPGAPKPRPTHLRVIK